jgi:oxygen-independent coproporphyrinogen-3 oxidase
MFIVQLNRPEYTYDVHSLVKAFFSEKQVKVITPDTNDSVKRALTDAANIVIEFAEDNSVQFRYYKFVTGEKEETGQFETAHAQIYKWNPAYEMRQDFSLADYKNALKRFLYQTLKEVTGKELPWGNLTGIRPTKIVMGMLEEGKNDVEIREFMRKSHFVSEKKIDLSLEIAERERKLLSTLHDKEGYSLYIGIPFCPTTCLYCSFTSYPICAFRDSVEAYIDCLIKEMELTAKLMQGKILDTVYIGGGTPTTLEAGQLDRLMKGLKSIFDFSMVQEFTVEAGRADSITRNKLEVLYQNGVTRISVNPQTMNEGTLRFIGRNATAAQTVEAFHVAREVGFDNINMDIILGLPNETEADVTETIRKITELAPDSLTA